MLLTFMSTEIWEEKNEGKIRYTDIVILTHEKKFLMSFQREMLLNINGYPEFCQHDEWIRVKVG